MKTKLLIATMLAASMSDNFPVFGREVDWWGDKIEPINTGRRAEKDAEALRKAEAKRHRRAQKRVVK